MLSRLLEVLMPDIPSEISVIPVNSAMKYEAVYPTFISRSQEAHIAPAIIVIRKVIIKSRFTILFLINDDEITPPNPNTIAPMPKAVNMIMPAIAPIKKMNMPINAISVSPVSLISVIISQFFLYLHNV